MHLTHALGLGVAAVALSAATAVIAAPGVPTATTPRVTASSSSPHTLARPTPAVVSGRRHHDGQPATVACGSCHATRPPNPANRAESLDLFHQGLRFVHGSTACLGCHDPKNYDGLRRSDGSHIGFDQAIELCAQCHGPQKRDYDLGLHGGLNGHWDGRFGPVERQSCLACHDPHAPAQPGFQPLPRPRDRGRQAAPGAHP